MTDSIVGKRFGMLIIKNKYKKFQSGRNVSYCNCICDCGNDYQVITQNIKRKKLCGLNCGCQKPKSLLTKDKLYADYIECKLTAKKIAIKYNVSERVVKEYIKIYQLTNIKKKGSGEEYCKKLRKGYGEISGSYICRCKHHAKTRNLKWNLTTEYLWGLFIKQNRICAYSGLELSFPEKHNSRELKKQTASIDRIDSNKSYEIGNVHWVHKEVNRIKWELSEDRFLEIINLIYKHQRKKKKE